VAAVWVLLFAHAFLGGGIGAWSVGIIYIAYDTVLLAFTFLQTWPLRRAARPAGDITRRPTLTVIVAAYNEEAVLESTITALGLQSEPPEQIIIADDGSTDGTAAILMRRYGFAQPEVGGISGESAVVPGLRWLRAPHAGTQCGARAHHHRDHADRGCRHGPRYGCDPRDAGRFCGQSGTGGGDRCAGTKLR
jgi:cellulose synthase/poly-beta-1,6-N-acetylglucosamine synthase-like glycosyltransferase